MNELHEYAETHGQTLKKIIYGIIVFCLVVIAAGGLLSMIADTLPEPPSLVSCSCAGHEDCHIRVFQVGPGRRATCAFWGKRQHCCMLASVDSQLQSEFAGVPE